MNILHRFLYVTGNVKQNFLMWPFLLANFAYAVAFIFFTNTATVQAAVLWKLTVANFPNLLISVWGAALLIVVIGAIVGIYVRKRWLGMTVTQAGAALWLYALILFIINGFWLQVFFAAAPHLMFWCWWYSTVRNYHEANLAKP